MENKKVPAEVYSRVSGYFRPVYTNGKTGQWNAGKREEYNNRKTITLEGVLNAIRNNN